MDESVVFASKKSMKMAVFSIVLVVFLLIVKINAEITSDSIAQFNIGQLFAFYDADGLCKSTTQFAVAKKGGEDCQWEIAEDFTPKNIDKETDLPVKDKDGNCYFACVFKTGRPRLHTEKVINRKLKADGIDRSNFDLYTYLAPCTKCINGPAPGGETAELDEFKAVYYSYKPEEVATKGSEVKNDDLLEKDAQKGLAAIQETTKVTLSNVKDAINNGKGANKSKQEIIDGVDDKYEKNAVKSYLDQHPLN